MFGRTPEVGSSQAVILRKSWKRETESGDKATFKLMTEEYEKLKG